MGFAVRNVGSSPRSVCPVFRMSGGRIACCSIRERRDIYVASVGVGTMVC